MDAGGGGRRPRGWMLRTPRHSPRRAHAVVGRFTALASQPQYQEDLPVVQPIVRRFNVEIGCCVACRHRVQGRHPLQTSDALGAAGVQLGPGAVTFTGRGTTLCLLTHDRTLALDELELRDRRDVSAGTGPAWRLSLYSRPS